MASAAAQPVSSGHPRLLRCDVVGAGERDSVRYIELEKFRLWEYVMHSEHGLTVRPGQLGLWVTYEEFDANPGPFLHGGDVEDVTCIIVSWFNPKRHYTLDVVRYVPADQCEALKDILLSHVGDDGRNSQYLELAEQRGVYVGNAIDEPELDLTLGLSDIHMKLDDAAT